MKLLFGTGNQAKLSAMKSRLKKIGIELIGLNDLKAEGKEIPQVAENGSTPLENARQKAVSYYKAFKMPVFSCDSGLYFENVPDEIQPGVHVRNVNGTCLSDEQMIAYYTGLAKKYGNLVAQYKNAICFVADETHIYESMDMSISGEKFILTDKPHSPIRKKSNAFQPKAVRCTFFLLFGRLFAPVAAVRLLSPQKSGFPGLRCRSGRFPHSHTLVQSSGSLAAPLQSLPQEATAYIFL